MKKIFFWMVLLLWSKANCQTLSGNVTDNITASISFDPSSQGYLSQLGTAYQGAQTASGDYKIFPAFGNSHTTLGKVVIVVEGWDQFDDFDVNDIFNFFSSSASTLRSNGYDIITLNFNDSKDYIERNAFLLVELINRVNNSKTSYDEISIIGASMGGLVARYALSYMEANNMNHECKLFTSFDTPNKGANIPMGIQFMVLDFVNQPFTTGVVFDMFFNLRSPAATQMLRYQIGSGGSNPPNLSTNMTKFFTSLRGLNGCWGYSKNAKNIGVSLGALNGNGQVTVTNPVIPMVSGATAFSYLVSLPSPVGPAQGGQVATWPTAPPIGPNGVFVCSNSGLFINTAHPAANAIPVDIAPGGFSPIFGLVADGIASMNVSGVNATVNKSCENACFIPVISALDYKETDLFYNISGDFNNNIHLTKTPFDEIFNTGFTDNKEHINVIPSSILNWIAQQIMNTPSGNNVCSGYNLSLSNVTQSSDFFKKVQNNLSLTNIQVTNNAKYNVFAGNEISVTGDCSFGFGTKSSLVIQSCNVYNPKGCSYSDPNLRVASDQDQLGDLKFTAESYLNNFGKNEKSVCVNLIQNQDSENESQTPGIYTIETCKEVSQSETGLTAEYSLKVFPSPSDGIFKVSFSKIADQERIWLKIISTNGTLIFEEQNFSDRTFDLSDYPEGIYLIQASSNSGYFESKKIAISK